MKRAAVEFGILTATAIALSFVFAEDSIFREEGLRPFMQALAVPFIPAFILAALVGGVHTAGQIHFGIAIFLELAVLWFLWKRIRAWRQRRG